MQLRNVAILSISQTMSISAVTIVVLVGGAIGSDLAPSPAWATLPISILIVGVAVSVIPAVLIMKRIGRQSGFMIGAVVAGLGALLAAYALARGSFLLFCAATLFIGVDGAFVQQYRFAATESVEPRYSGRAVSFVLLGSVLAGYVGPELVKRSKDWLTAGTYTGSFVSLGVLFAIVAALMYFFKDVAPQKEEALGGERPLREIVTQPIYFVAVLAGAVSYAVMSFIMTATPLYLLHTYSLEQAALVIQSHVIAMYLPFLFTGIVLERLGLLRVMVLGVLSMFACVILGVIGREFIHLWGALVLLGIGWNFVFVGATVLLTRSYLPAERFKAQAVNDFTIFGIQALGALFVGTVLFYANWDFLNLINVPLLLLAFVAILLLRTRMTSTPSKA